MKEVQLNSMKRKISKITSLTLYFFSIGKIHENGNIFLMEIFNGICLHLISIRQSLWTPRAIFQWHNPGLLQYKIPIDFFIPLLYYDKLKGAFNSEILEIVHTFEWISFELWGIKKYREIKPNLNWGYLGTDMLNHYFKYYYTSYHESNQVEGFKYLQYYRQGVSSL